MTAPLALRQTQPARPPSCWRCTLATAARIAGAILMIVGAVAVVVAVVGAPAARRRLDFRFAGLPATAFEALSVFAHNVRVLAAAVGLLLIAQAPLHVGVHPGPIVRGLRSLGELLIAGIAVANMLVVGAGLGAYGARMVAAVVPHGPLELAAYSLALALYAHGRSSPLALGHAAVVLAACVLLLAGGAALEVFAAP